MKKIFALVLAGILGISACMIAFAAPSDEEPSEVVLTQDENSHSVYAFGTALVLIYQDGSIEISSMGPAGRVDVMMDGVVIENVATVRIPAGQRTRLALEDGSIIVNNVTEESGEAVKEQIEESYAAGAESIDPASLTEVAAYRVNKAGKMENADGKAVTSEEAFGMSISSIDATVKSFLELMEEIMAEDRAKEAAAAQAAVANKADSSSSSSKSGATPAPIPASSTGSSSSSGSDESAAPAQTDN